MDCVWWMRLIIVDNCVNNNAADNIISPSFLFYLDLIAANFPLVIELCTRVRYIGSQGAKLYAFRFLLSMSLPLMSRM